MTKTRNDFRVYEEETTLKKPIWRVRSGGHRGDCVSSCNSLSEATVLAKNLNIDPYFLERGQTRNDRNG
jgi:hypothetical protein